MPGQSLRIDSYSRAHAESLHTLLLTDSTIASEPVSTAG